MWKSSCPDAICWNKIILSSSNGIGILVKEELTRDACIYFCSLSCAPLIYMSILKPEPQSLNYCDLAVSFEIGKCESSNFIFSQHFWGLFYILWTSINILWARQFPPKKKKKVVGILIGLHWIYRLFGSIAISTVLSLPIREHRYIFIFHYLGHL